MEPEYGLVCQAMCNLKPVAKKTSITPRESFHVRNSITKDNGPVQASALISHCWLTLLFVLSTFNRLLIISAYLTICAKDALHVREHMPGALCVPV